MTRADYVSGHLSEQEVRRLFNAAVLAFCISKHLSRFISIHLDAGGVVDRREFIWRFNKLASEWLKARTGHPACYLWVLEKPVDGMKTYSRGFNVHILVHVPYHLQNDFYRKESDWLKAAGAKSARGVRKSRKIDFSGPDYPGAHYLREGLLGLMRYLAKGIEPASASIFGIKPEPQGKVSGKRSGYAEALGEKQRRSQQFRVAGRSSIFMPQAERRRRRFVALSCPELLGLPPIDEDDLRWE